LICYEAIFPDDVVGATRPDWFVNVTNDAWFGPWAGPRQHLVSARVRAIEEGIPVVRAANTGISAVIDGTGRVVSSLALNQTGVLNASLPKVLSLTVYGQYGDLVFLILLLLCVAGAGVRGRK
jgi:apolipoprotein N-acyltransferase